MIKTNQMDSTEDPCLNNNNNSSTNPPVSASPTLSSNTDDVANLTVDADKEGKFILFN